MERPKKPASDYDTLEQLKAQLAKSKPVLVDSTGRMFMGDNGNQPAPTNQQYTQPPISQPTQPMLPPTPPVPPNPNVPPTMPVQNEIANNPQNGVRVTPSRWF